MYGLEAGEFNDSIEGKLDIFHRRALRQKVSIPTTYGVIGRKPTVMLWNMPMSNSERNALGPNP
eukprot:4038305-Karenia_brevis.AAC.1